MPDADSLSHHDRSAPIAPVGARAANAGATPGRFALVMPTVPPAPGGASRYGQILANALVAAGHDACVISETGPGAADAPGWDPRVARKLIFPHRAGRAEKPWHVHGLYALQNLRFLGLPGVVRAAFDAMGQGGRRGGKPGRATVLIHSSFFYNPSLMGAAVARLRRALPDATLAVDVRDPKSPEPALCAYAAFDRIIACSEAIADSLNARPALRGKVRHIPIPFAPSPTPSAAETAAILARRGLTGRRFLLNPGGVSREKGFDAMLAATRALRTRPGWADVTLVTIGRLRDLCASDRRAEAEGVLTLIGPVGHPEVLALGRAALAALIVSRVEGLPRAALEIIAAGGRALIPPIPEFRRAMPGWVARDLDPQALAAQIAGLTGDPGNAPPAQDYDIGAHDMARLIPLYTELAGD